MACDALLQLAEKAVGLVLRALDAHSVSVGTGPRPGRGAGALPPLARRRRREGARLPQAVALKLPPPPAASPSRSCSRWGRAAGSGGAWRQTRHCGSI